MYKEFEGIRKSFSNFKKFEILDDKEWAKFIDDSIVVLQAGGESSRFRYVMGGADIQKTAFKLPSGDTMIELTIDLYKQAGIKNFVVLACHAADSVRRLLGDGHKYGVDIKYSEEPTPLGSGGAIYYAIKKGIIPKGKTIIVHNPDDLILGNPDFPRYLASGHVDSVSRGNLMTISVYPTRDYPGSAVMVNKGQVKAIEYHPQLPIPIHTGITIISPDMIPLFEKEITSFDHKTEFENLFFPMLAKEDKLGAVDFPKGEWIPVNDDKMYNRLVDYLEKRK